MNNLRCLLFGAAPALALTLPIAAIAGHAQGQTAPTVSVLYMTPAGAGGGGDSAYVRTIGDEVAYSLHALAPAGAKPDAQDGDAPQNAPARTIDLKWPEDRIDWMFVRIGGSHMNLNECPHDADPLRSQAFALEGVGAGMIGLRLQPRVSEASADELKAWLEAHAMPGDSGSGPSPALGPALSPALASALSAPSKHGAPDGSLMVRTIECAQTVVRAFDPADHTFDTAASPAVVAKCGLGMEIRINFDPTAYLLPTDIAVRAYIDQEGAKIQSLVVSTLDEAADPSKWTFVRCDDKGIAAIHLEHHKPYLIRMVAARPSREPGADIEVMTASVTFLAGRSTEVGNEVSPSKIEQDRASPEGRE